MFRRFVPLAFFCCFISLIHSSSSAQDIDVRPTSDLTIPSSLSKNNTRAVEIPSMRNRFSTHYKMENGNYKMVSSSASWFYQTTSGWEAIDNTIRTKDISATESHPFTNTSNKFKSAFPRQVLSGGIITRLDEGTIEEKLEAVYTVNGQGHIISSCRANACQAVACADATITYENIFPNVSIKYTQQNDGRKFDLIIHDAAFVDALPIDAKYLVIKEKLSLPKHFTISKDDNGYNIYNGKMWLTHLQTPIGYDKNNTSDEDQLHGLMSIENEGGDYIISTKFSVDWMRNSQRQFPLHLDPTMTFYPDSVLYATGRMITGGPTKISGYMNVMPAIMSWANFNISTLPSGANITDGHYWGYHYVGSGTGDKKAKIIGMQSINPISANSSQINAQLGAGPLYDTNYIWGSNIFGWHSDTLNATALSDIASQQGQGWTAFVFAYQSGVTNSMLQYGYDAVVGNKPYLEINYTLTPCAGIPNPGNTISNMIYPCTGAIINLTIQNILNLGSGISYQWYKNGVLIAGATNATYAYTASAIADTAWCEVTCNNSGLSASSTPVIIGSASYLNCYCLSNATSTNDEEIFNVTFNGSSTNSLYANANGCVNVAPGPGSMLSKYSSFLTLPSLVNLLNGMSVSFSIEQDECDNAPYFNNQVGIWIDWNHNATFNEPGELIYMSPFGAGPRVLTGVFTVPMTALSGNTVMRIVCKEGTSPTPCGTYDYGETEDYLLGITGTPCFFSSSLGSTLAFPSNVCQGGLCNLSMQLPPNPSSAVTYQWYDASGAIIGATNSTYTTIINATNTFYCQATCPAPLVMLSSVPVTVNMVTPTSGVSSVTSCDSYIWGSLTITSSGTYTQTLINAVGCDSVHTLNLTIHNSTSSSVSLAGCDSIQHNGIYYSSSGTYVQNFMNAAGCDSVVSILITINNSLPTSFNIDACNSFLYGGSTYSNDTSLNYTFTNAAGCDSIVTLHINIDTLNAMVMIAGSSLTTPNIGTYQWIDCSTMTPITGATSISYTPAVSGDYAVEVTVGACVDTSVCISYWMTNIENTSALNQLEIYPNPTQGIFDIRTKADAVVNISNALGETILNKTYKKGKHEIDLSAYANGIYYVKVTQGDKSKTIKLLKE